METESLQRPPSESEVTRYALTQKDWDTYKKEFGKTHTEGRGGETQGAETAIHRPRSKVSEGARPAHTWKPDLRENKSPLFKPLVCDTLSQQP